MGRARPTIQEVAELAGVSKGTASKALNGQKGISEETRNRVLRVAGLLDYEPDSAARALARKRSGTLGFLIPHEAEASFRGQYWSSILAGLSQRATERGYNLLVLTTAREGDVGGALRRFLSGKVADGLIIGSELLDKEGMATLVARDLPFVLLGRNPEFSHHCVTVDNVGGTVALVEHMIARGYRRIGAFLGPSAYPYVEERERGYRETIRRHGLGWEAVAHAEYSPEAARQGLSDFLDKATGMDALFLGSGGDFLFEALRLLRGRRLEVPSFGLGVFDDYPFFDVLTPRITAVAQPLALAGETAVDLLLRLMDVKPAGDQVIQLPTRLVPRESCGEALGPS